MGMMRLRDFRLMVAKAVGDTGLSNEILDLYINMGYIDVMVSKRHKNLLVMANLNTVAGTDFYPLPCDLLGIDSLKINGEEIRLIRGEPRNIRSHTRLERGRPKIYTRVGQEINFWPVPDKEYDIEMWYFKEAPRLTDASQQTIFPSTLDVPLYYFAVYHAISALGKLPEDQAITWLQRGQSWFQRHEDDEDFGSGDITLPVDVVTSTEELFENMRVSL